MEVIYHDLVTCTLIEIIRSVKDGLVQLYTQSVQCPGNVIELDRTCISASRLGRFRGNQQGTASQEAGKEDGIYANSIDPRSRSLSVKITGSSRFQYEPFSDCWTISGAVSIEVNYTDT